MSEQPAMAAVYQPDIAVRWRRAKDLYWLRLAAKSAKKPFCAGRHKGSRIFALEVTPRRRRGRTGGKPESGLLYRAANWGEAHVAGTARTKRSCAFGLNLP